MLGRNKNDMVDKAVTLDTVAGMHAGVGIAETETDDKKKKYLVLT